MEAAAIKFFLTNRIGIFITLVALSWVFYKVGFSTWLSVNSQAVLLESCNESTACTNYLNSPPKPPGIIHDTRVYTPGTWALSLLERMGYPTTDSNVQVIVAWEYAEGGHWQNTATYNPLNTTQVINGLNRPINPVGVQAYGSWDEGFQATIKTLNYDRYANVRAQLLAGNNASELAKAIVASGWGTKSIGV